MNHAPRYLGCHVSSSGGFEQAIQNAITLGVNTIQLHPSPPQRWNAKAYPKGYEDAFREKRKNSGVEKVFFHAIYLINLATPDLQKFTLAQLSLQHHLDLCDRIGGDGVIFHVGSAVNQPTEADGIKRAAEGIAAIMENTKHLSSKLLLEVSAGSGSIIGDRPEELQEIVSLLPDRSRVGFALDTQHLWASGLDIQDTERVVQRVTKAFGADIYAIHLNDSMTELASRKDRHANLGEGKIGKEALASFINHPSLCHIPVILETPGLKSIDTAGSEVAQLKSMAK